MHDRRRTGMIVVLIVAWGSTFAAVKVGLEHAPPVLFGGIRSVVGGLVVLAIALRLGRKPRVREHLRWYVLLTLLNVPAPRAGRLPMMLSEFDLPPAAGVVRPWVGTTPKQALRNLAATGCDRSSFHGGGWQHSATRSFLVPGSHLSAAFGITETVGRLPTSKAKAFIEGVRSRLGSCSDRELGTKVHRIGGDQTMTAWQVRTQVSDKQTVTFLMGVVRSGGAVAQVGFVADGRHTMSSSQFVWLVRRAGERLIAMPA